MNFAILRFSRNIYFYLSAILSVLVLTWDLFYDLGIIAGLAYGTLMIFSIFQQKHREVFQLAFLFSLFIIIGGITTLLNVFFPGLEPWYLVLIDRILGIGIVWLSANLIVRYKILEKSRLDSEREFEKILNRAPLPILIARVKDNTILYANKAAAKLLNIPMKELVGRQSLKFFSNPKDQKKVQQLIELDGYVDSLELQLKDVDNALISILTSVRPIQFRGEKAFITANADITIQKKSEQRFKDLLETAPDAFLIVDEDFNIRLSNQQAEKLFGYSKEKIQNLIVLDLFDQDYKAAFKKRVQQFYHNPAFSEKQFGIEKYCVNSQGTSFPVEISVSPIELDNKRVISVAVRNISERKKAEQQIIRSRDYYLTLLENFPSMIWRADTEGNCDYFNSTWLKFRGRSMDEEKGKGWEKGVHPEDIARCRDNYYTAIKEGKPFYIEYRMQRYDGEFRWLADYGRPMEDLDGKYIGFLGSCYDITDKKLAEEEIRTKNRQFQTAQQIAHIGSWEWEVKTNFVSWSDELYRIYGYNPGEVRVSFEKYLAHVEEGLREHVKNTISDSLKTKKPFESRYAILTNRGEKKILHSKGDVLLDEKGKVEKLIGTCFDITNQHKAELEIRESQKKFEAIFNQTFEFVGLLKPDGTVIEANDTAILFSGKKEEELVGKFLWETSWFSYSEDTSHLIKTSVENAADGQFVRHEVKVLGAEKRFITVDFSIKPIYDEEGNVKWLIQEARDITPRIVAEKELRKKQKQLVEAQTIAKLGNWARDLKTGQVEMSDEMFNIYGIEQTDNTVSVETLLQFRHPIDEKLASTIIEESIKEKKPFDYYIRIMDGNRNLKILHIRGQVITDKKGKAIKLKGTSQDVTELRKAQEELKTKHDQLMDAQEIAHVGSWVWDVISNELTVSEELKRLYGFEQKQELVFNHLVESVVERDRHKFQTALQNTLKEYQPFDLIYRVYVNGHVRILHGKGRVLKENDRAVKLYGTAVDITELKKAEDRIRESEEKFRHFVETSNDLIWSVDKNHRWTYLNPTASRETYEYDPDDLIGTYFEDLSAEHQKEKDRAFLQEIRKKGIAFQHQTIHLNKKGKEKIIRFNGVALRDSEGNYIGATGSASDITELVQTEKFLRDTESALRILHDITSGQQTVESESKIEALLKFGCERFDMEIGYLLHVSDSDVKVENIFGFNGILKDMDELDFEYFYFTEQLKKGEPIIIEEASHTNWKQDEFFKNFKIHSYIGDRIEIGGEVYGTLNFLSRKSKKQPFRPTDNEIIKLMGQWVGGVIQRDQVKQKMLNAIVETEEQERKRFAEDIHDGLGQLLSAVKLNLTSLESNLSKVKDDPERLNQMLDKSKSLVDYAMHEAKAMSHNLMPASLENYGLGKTLENLSDNMSQVSRIPIHFHPFNIERRYDKNLEIGLYRITQELMHNALKHAEPNEINLQLIQHKNSIILMVEDDGKGFDENLKEEGNMMKGKGLKSIQTRVKSLHGTYSIDSSPGQGTVITVEIPINQ